MASNAQRGQVMIELVIVSLFFIAFFCAAMSMTVKASQQNKQYRFKEYGGRYR